MNKVILSLILAVCVLGMALIMLNERLGRKSEPAPAPVVESGAPASPEGNAGLSTLPSEQAHNALSSPAAPSREQDRQEPALPPLPPLPVDPQGGQNAPIVERDVPQALPQESTMPGPQADAARRAEPPAVPAAEKTPAETPAAQQKKADLPAQAEKGKAGKSRAEKPKTEKTANNNAPAVAKAAGGERSISRFVIFARDKGATVRLVGSVPIRYKTMALTNPERLVVDLEGQWQIKAPGVPENVLVRNVRIGKMADKTRVVIDLSEKPARTRFVLSKDRNTLDVRVDQ
ncbi:AMIN domain-containing protein [Desulfovibrio sp. ZJ200]|uniref:AMIN domain-containing protein n=1 Tax=Desulfovibrio sp. ZJ200 TaxID=2709792 RepID=UPI0013EA60C6|nr:AMIN domain-containing protein [Desulfovibrio sp. ZJ200]